MMKAIGRSMLALVVSMLASGAVRAQDAAKPPNVVIVVFDDLGTGQVGAYSRQTTFSTPNLDRLVAQGMMFTDAHSASSVCTPSRYALLTGRYPYRIGQYAVLDRRSPPIIPPDRLTIGSLVRQVGYRTACVGKWHLGARFEAPPSSEPRPDEEYPLGTRCDEGPLSRGFESCWFYTEARSYETLFADRHVVAVLPRDEVQPWLTRRSVEYIDERARDGAPFLLFVALPSPHPPMRPSAAFRGRTASQAADWLLEGDAALGEIVDAIDRGGLSERTLIVVTSDNGAAEASPGIRGRKGGAYEGGHRVPFVARWTKTVPPGTVNRSLVSSSDLFSTIATLARAPKAPRSGEDSVDLAATLRDGAPVPSRILVAQSIEGDFAIREAGWKLILRRGDRPELYDVARDPLEATNLAPRNSAVVKRLRRALIGEICAGRSTPGQPQQNEKPPLWVLATAGLKGCP